MLQQKARVPERQMAGHNPILSWGHGYGEKRLRVAQRMEGFEERLGVLLMFETMGTPDQIEAVALPSGSRQNFGKAAPKGHSFKIRDGMRAKSKDFLASIAELPQVDSGPRPDVEHSSHGQTGAKLKGIFGGH